MTTRKNYNSIVFLTTLSVYLGLVLVGAPAPVLAQKVLTREQYEIELNKQNKEELEKPLNDANLFVPQIVQLINELNLFSNKKQFDWNAKNHSQIESLSFCESDNSPSFEGSGLDNRKINKVFDGFAIRLSREISKRRVADGFGDFYSQSVSFDFSTDNSTFSLKITTENKNSQDNQVFYSEVVAYFERFASFPKSSKEKVIYENTKITSDNNQVIVVTRLPRGSLDALLVKDGAK